MLTLSHNVVWLVTRSSVSPQCAAISSCALQALLQHSPLQHKSLQYAVSNKLHYASPTTQQSSMLHTSSSLSKVVPTRFKPRSSSANTWLTRQLNDPYVKKAHKLSYRWVVLSLATLVTSVLAWQSPAGQRRIGPVAIYRSCASLIVYSLQTWVIK